MFPKADGNSNIIQLAHTRLHINFHNGLGLCRGVRYSSNCSLHLLSGGTPQHIWLGRPSDLTEQEGLSNGSGLHQQTVPTCKADVLQNHAGACVAQGHVQCSRQCAGTAIGLSLGTRVMKRRLHGQRHTNCASQPAFNVYMWASKGRRRQHHMANAMGNAPDMKPAKNPAPMLAATTEHPCTQPDICCIQKNQYDCQLQLRSSSWHSSGQAVLLAVVLPAWSSNTAACV
jgi:hypothetical protein